MFNEFHHQARGRGHELDGTRGQDRTQYLSRGDVQAICLADGAGSASHSEFGAQAVVDEGCVALVEQFDQLVARIDGGQVKIELLERLLAKVTTVAERHGRDVQDFASTFLGVAVSGDQFLGAHVGDGVIGYLKNGELHVCSAPDNSEFANQTTFVTSSGAAGSMRLFRGSLQGVTGFILMSDGAGESLFNARTRQLAAACTKIIVAVGATPTRLSRNSKPKKQLRKLVDVRVRNATKDDCSIGVLGRP
ncbi:PP2C family serine/threonine-protein phosphatase [Cryobacterium sp. SO1]|uniref:PP2C family serine/threonine-protein phosphatase n=1 Tax=Cryobacterium sp. SO1 TaxID=1897061 RepID=UPI0010237749|nr:PP2C family serine/threonine-protein phosphatase [Cryobacterium sp. SO1]